MNILLVTDYFYPISSGGTEKYIYLLAKHLVKNHEVKILSIHEQLKESMYHGINITYIVPNTNYRRNIVRGINAPNNLSAFEDYIKYSKPDIIHFHTITTNFNHHHIQLSFKLGIKTFFTSHIPGHQCLRGDFMQYGKTPCDGKIEKNKCSKCFAFSRNDFMLKKINRYIYYSISANNPADLKLRQLKSIESSTNKIIAVSQWQKEFLEKNGISKCHLVLCRQSVTSKKIQKSQSADGKIRLGFIGRVEPIKGLHLLLNALNSSKHLNFNLKIAAISPSLEHQNYFERIRTISQSLDCRWLFNLNKQQIEDFFADIDYLVIPSLCYETGPFVAYEALAYNTPILCTNIGGQKELIINGKNGYSFDPYESDLVKLLARINTLPVLKQANTNTYNEDKIALDMQAIYLEQKYINASAEINEVDSTLAKYRRNC